MTLQKAISLLTPDNKFSCDEGVRVLIMAVGGELLDDNQCLDPFEFTKDDFIRDDWQMNEDDE